MEHTGVPIDVEMLQRFRQYWGDIQDRLIADIDRDYGVYVNGSFIEKLFERYLAEHGIPWPRLPSGRLELNACSDRWQKPIRLSRHFVS
jgi:hypothetical protein